MSSLIKSIGGLVGAIEISCTYPTEYIKTVMQLDKVSNSLGTVGTIKETFRTYGMLGFYRGYSALLIFSMPKNGVRFGAYEFAATNMFKEKTKFNSFLCGLVAGSAEALAVVTPQETIKTKLIHDKMQDVPKYKNVFQGIYRIGMENGPKGLYLGVVPTLLKQSTNQGVRFFVFADTKERISPFFKNKILVDLISGGFAGFCSVMFNNPIDVIKTKMQGVGGESLSVASTFKYIMETRGPMGFYSGVVPRLSRVILDAALTFSLFHSIKRAVTQLIAGNKAKADKKE